MDKNKIFAVVTIIFIIASPIIFEEIDKRLSTKRGGHSDPRKEKDRNR